MAAVGAAFGLRRSIGYFSGLVAGTIAVLVAVATGVVSLLLSVPHAAPVLVAASAAYILYLAYRIATAPPLSKLCGDIAAPSFAGGFALAIANPKAYVAIAAVFAGTTLADDPAPDALLKTTILAVMIVAIHMAWLLAGTVFSRVFYDPVYARIANAVFAVTLVVTAAIAFVP
jgi:threonine/homoserine/homoserine lactone efflux protein